MNEPTTTDSSIALIKWLLFEPGDSREYIRDRFTARYGVDAQTVTPTGGGQLAGPLPEDAGTKRVITS